MNKDLRENKINLDNKSNEIPSFGSIIGDME